VGTQRIAKPRQFLLLPLCGPVRNATSHANRHGHDCSSAPAMQHSGGADVTVALHR